MERIIAIPDGVTVDVSGLRVAASGPKGKLERDFSSPLFADAVTIKKTDRAVLVATRSYRRKVKAEVGCIAAHIRNIFAGVTVGYVYRLKVVYQHFPVTVKVAGRRLLISNFLGERAPRVADIVGDAKVEVSGDEIIVSGGNIEDVGQTSANIERATWIPARDRRVFQDGIFRVSP